MSYLSALDEASWLEAAERGADWWIAHVPEDRVAFWDFDDPAIPDTERDTAAAAVASSGLLKLAKAATDKAARAKYRAAAEATITALVTHYLTPTSPAVAITPEPEAASVAPVAERAGVIEIEFATGGRMRITGAVDAPTVTALMKALAKGKRRR